MIPMTHVGGIVARESGFGDCGLCGCGIALSGPKLANARTYALRPRPSLSNNRATCLLANLDDLIPLNLNSLNDRLENTRPSSRLTFVRNLLFSSMRRRSDVRARPNRKRLPLAERLVNDLR